MGLRCALQRTSGVRHFIEDACGGPSPHPINVCMLCASCFEHQAAEAGAEAEAEAEAMHILGKGKGTLVKICVRNSSKSGNCIGNFVKCAAERVAEMFKNRENVTGNDQG